MTELLAEGRNSWPTLGSDPPVAAVVARKAGDKPLDATAATLDPSEVFLAAALLGADPAATPAFEKRYFPVAEAALTRAGGTKDEVDEVLQTLRVRLYTPADDGVPRLVDYCGAGRLGGLVRVAAVRALINLRAKHKPSDELDDGIADCLVADLDPERARVKEEERAAVRAAIRETARALPGRSRTLLRLSLVKGLSIDELGRVFGIHRATAARQLAQARSELIAGVRARLAERWGDQADALTLVSTSLEITLGSALAGTEDPPL
jgi:RNA polymerase sigma-70 factor (ECF subfamily)